MPGEIKSVVLLLLNIFYYVLLARIIMSFLQSMGRPNTIVLRIYRVLFALTEPLLKHLRGIIPPLRTEMGHVDLSPLALLVILIIVERVLWSL